MVEIVESVEIVEDISTYKLHLIGNNLLFLYHYPDWHYGNKWVIHKNGFLKTSTL